MANYLKNCQVFGIFDLQMAIFRRVRYQGCQVSLQNKFQSFYNPHKFALSLPFSFKYRILYIKKWKHSPYLSAPNIQSICRSIWISLPAERFIDFFYSLQRRNRLVSLWEWLISSHHFFGIQVFSFSNYYVFTPIISH